MKSKIASATYSSMPGRDISRSLPTLALDPVGEPLEPAPEPVDPADCPLAEPVSVGMIESVDVPSRAAGSDSAASMVGKTFKFSFADSF
jgi:hypothetical protein